MLVALLLIGSFAHGETVVIEPAGIQLERPSGAELIGKEDVKVKVSNFCFPRIKLVGGSQIDCVISMREFYSLRAAFDWYIRQQQKNLGKGDTVSEISRGEFTSKGGVKGLWCRLDFKRKSACLPNHLIRYIFRNKKGEIVCMGGFGDVDQINKLVMKSLA